MNVDWTIFRGPQGAVAVPLTPMMMKLRRVVSDEFFEEQAALAPLKRLMDAMFVIGPSAILISFYLPKGAGLLVWLGIICLAVAALYWFGTHFLCRIYLTRKGYSMTGPVNAPDYRTAIAMAKGAP